ncbi:MAG: hypothetical protein CMF75_09620 [Maricaulis sp.]|nr:hypothetical protein [Maricaulis sp.]
MAMLIILMAGLVVDAELGGCGDAASQAEALAAIEAQNAEVQAALEAGDMARYAQVFTEDAWQVSPNSMPLEGRAAIQAHWEGLAALGEWRFALTALDVWACQGSAIERGYGELSFQPNEAMAADMPAFTASAHYVAHWIEAAPGEWRVRSDVAAAAPQ